MTNETNKEDLINEAVEAINERCESETNFQENEESSIAEFVGSFCYGESGHEIRDFIRQQQYKYLTDDQEAFLKSLLSKTDKDLCDIFGNFCSIELTHGIRSVTNEVTSRTIGEVEVEIDDILDQYPSELHDEIAKKCDSYVSKSYAYIDFSYDRWSMVLDTDLLQDFIEAQPTNIIPFRRKA